MNENIQFEVDSADARPAYVPQKASGFATWLMGHSRGLVKDEQQANYVLLAFAVLAFAISIYLFVGATSTNVAPEVPAVSNQAV